MDTNIEEKKKLTKNRQLTEQELKAIEKTKQKKRINLQPIFRTNEGEDASSLELAYDTSLEFREASDLMDSLIMETTGSNDSGIGLRMLSHIAKATIGSKAKNEMIVKELNGLGRVMRALSPQDEYEAQLIAQLTVLHEHSMDWLGRAMRTERVDFANIYLNGASKLLARHHETLDALLKYRRKGEQRVHVEHVHVHEGGQAIVGNVSTGMGMNPKTVEGPHAKV